MAKKKQSKKIPKKMLLKQTFTPQDVFLLFHSYLLQKCIFAWKVSEEEKARLFSSEISFKLTDNGISATAELYRKGSFSPAGDEEDDHPSDEED